MGGGNNNMRRGGKHKAKAVLKHLADVSSQNYATRRLMRDLKEVETNDIPTVGVTAKPLDDNLFEWACNLRGPEGTSYEGGVFHVHLLFPENYPHDPPTVSLFTTLPHPCVSGTTICLDMLDGSNRGVYRGWISGYSVLSILLQLQAFLFEEEVDDSAQRKKEVKMAVKQANEFYCSCGHRGPLGAWPPFNTKETDLSSFLMVKTEEERIREELVCFHTKLNFVETALGIGLTISRIPRTGEIRMASPTMDFISLKAFIKEDVRQDLENQRFTHWLPLYFGDKEERTLHLARKAISMVCTGSTKKFEEQQVLELLPKLIQTIIYQMMDEKKHTSLKALRLLIYFHRLFLLLIKAHPGLVSLIEEKLNKFAASEDGRSKDAISSLAAMLACVSVAPNVTWTSLKEAYLQEHFDRQVFWMLLDLPQLEKDTESPQLDANRAEISFKSGIVSNHILLFFSYFFTKIARPEGKSLDQLSADYDRLRCRLPVDREEQFQSECEAIKKIKSFNEFFPRIGLPVQSGAELNALLKKAISNSHRRKYHGTEDEVHKLPPKPEMTSEYQRKKVDTLSLLREGVLPEAEDPCWKAAALERWSWVEELHFYGHSLSPQALIDREERIRLENYYKGLDDNQTKRNGAFWGDEINSTPFLTAYRHSDEAASWREFFVKTDFEEFLEKFECNPDFKKLYKLLELAKPVLHSLSFMITNTKIIKSGFHYLTSTLTKLTGIKQFNVVRPMDFPLGLKGTKALHKGILNFKQAGGQLLKLQLNNLNVTSLNEACDLLYQSASNCPNLLCLDLSQNEVTQYFGKLIGRMLVEHKHLQELVLNGCAMSQVAAKEVADGLMRARQLSIVKVCDNPLGAPGLQSILYNLAFSPRVTHIDVSGTTGLSQNQDLTDTLYKLLNISASLEVLILRNCDLAINLSDNFFKALGANRTLRFLDMTCTGSIQQAKWEWLGKAVAFNAKKQGSLETLLLDGGRLGVACFHTFYNNLYVSAADHEQWYGDPNKASKMTGDDLVKQFYFKLRNFTTGCNSFHDSYSFDRKRPNMKEPIIVQFLTRALTMTRLNCCDSGMNKNDMDLLARALNPLDGPSIEPSVRFINLQRNPLMKDGVHLLCAALENNHTVEHLDLSGTKMGVSGAVALAKMLKVNKSVKWLSLYSNKADVDGVRALSEALKVNTTLETLDVGFNRIRDKGMEALGAGIVANPHSALRSLGVRYNFISEDGFLHFISTIAGHSQLKELYVKFNQLSEPGLIKAKEMLAGRPIFVDMFSRLNNLSPSALQNSVWISPFPFEPSAFVKFIEFVKDCGVVVNIRARSGPPVPGKPADNRFAIVEFAHQMSVTRALHLASKKKSVLNGIKFRVYRAGTSTHVLIKKPKGKSRLARAVAPTMRVARGRGGFRGRGRRGRH